MINVKRCVNRYITYQSQKSGMKIYDTHARLKILFRKYLNRKRSYQNIRTYVEFNISNYEFITEICTHHTVHLNKLINT